MQSNGRHLAYIGGMVSAPSLNPPMPLR